MRRSALLATVLAAAAAAVHGSSIEYEEEGGGRVVAEALGYLGVPYRLAGADSGGVDCSGLVCAVYRAAAGQELPRTVSALMGRGRRVEGGVRAGDLLFFDTTGGPSHVGIAIDGLTFVHAASEGPVTGVIVSSINERYYRDRFLEARRLLVPGPGRVVMRIDGQPVQASLAAPVPVGGALEFALVAAGEAGAGERKFVTFRAMLDGKQMIARRLRVGAGGDTGVWLVPAAGRWTVTVEAEEGVLAELAFEAGGTP